MKRILLFILAISIMAVPFCSGCTLGNKVITLTPSGKNDTAQIKSAINSLKKRGELILNEGTYYVDDELKINNKRNIKIKGKNATLIRTGVELKNEKTDNNRVFYFEGCENVAVSGLTIKYDAVTSVSGVVVERLASDGKIIIKPNDNQNPKGNETYCAINTFDEDGTPNTVLEKYNNDGFDSTLNEDGTISLSGFSYDEVNLLTNGTRVGLRASLSSDPVIKILDTADIVFEHITVHNSFSGVFFTDGRTTDVTLRKINISPEDENSYFSSNADGLHVAAMGGKLLVKDCTFIGLGDDCVNVHGAGYTVKSVTDNTVMGYNDRYNVPAMSFWAREGDEIEFYDKYTFRLLGSAKLKKIVSTSGEMTFDEIPEGVRKGVVMSNKTMHPTVEITGCIVISNRARAFLIQTEDAVIKNCAIRNTRLAAILIAPDMNYWYEMSPGRNITISNNMITNCGKGADAAILIAAAHDVEVAYPADVNRDITIKNNTFNACPSALRATSVKGLTFTNNTLNNIGAAHLKYAVTATRCEGVSVKDNILNNCTVKLYE